MARGIPVVLPSKAFSKKGDAKDFFRQMLYRYKPKERVNGADSLLLTELLQFHAEYIEKVGNGIDHFEVMRADYNTQCFCIVRKDGTHTDFSFIHCIDNVRK